MFYNINFLKLRAVPIPTASDRKCTSDNVLILFIVTTLPMAQTDNNKRQFMCMSVYICVYICVWLQSQLLKLQ
jgi:hypothetical protein